MKPMTAVFISKVGPITNGGPKWDMRHKGKARLSIEIQPITGGRNGIIFTFMRVWSRKFAVGVITCRR